ncbi:hypothetical protein H2201_007866 [Coniosporium apollinis]|uniref:Extracellular serine-rich protein n=1 Tax=Coniosporium apollinis TaxID=61459 RepID=A0ABQ9NKL9_9PEZI|nr:hypothetical protein H2201_007866 [Coniosporium apollinis]
MSTLSSRQSWSPTASDYTAVSTASSAAAQTHTISVGNGDFKFRPDVVQAQPGDTIEFQFYPQNHSAVRAEYLHPCIPYEMTGRGKVGFFTGFHPVDAMLDDPPMWSVLVNDTDPIFFYCSGPRACTKYAMVGVINPNKSVSLQTQREIALDSAYVLNPGDSFPDEGGTSSTMASSTAAPSLPTSSLPSVSPTVAAPAATPSEHSNHSGLSPGAIAGVAIGSAAVLLLAAFLFYFFGRARTLQKVFERDKAGFAASGPHSPEMYRSGGEAFIPAGQQGDYRSRSMSQPYNVSPGSQSPEEGAPLCSATVRTPYSVLGGAYSPPADRYVAVDIMQL